MIDDINAGDAVIYGWSVGTCVVRGCGAPANVIAGDAIYCSRCWEELTALEAMAREQRARAGRWSRMDWILLLFVGCGGGWILFEMSPWLIELVTGRGCAWVVR